MQFYFETGLPKSATSASTEKRLFECTQSSGENKRIKNKYLEDLRNVKFEHLYKLVESFGGPDQKVVVEQVLLGAVERPLAARVPAGGQLTTEIGNLDPHLTDRTVLGMKTF